jgi:hypothetical protein
LEAKYFWDISTKNRWLDSYIIAIKEGICYGLEVKREGNKQSETQIAFGEGMIKAGARYYVVYGINDVKKIGL